MKITVEFNSLQELDEFCNGVAIAPALAKKVSVSAEPDKEAPRAPEANKTTPKSTKAQDEAPAKANVQETEKDERKEVAPAPEADKPVDTGALKVEVRKLLAQVNKKTGSNTASQWIKELTSVEKLTEVENGEELLALKAKAEEVLNG
jgi:hypothetical protein